MAVIYVEPTKPFSADAADAVVAPAERTPAAAHPRLIDLVLAPFRDIDETIAAARARAKARRRPLSAAGKREPQLTIRPHNPAAR
ncbi:MAG TPA: hypothetical protein VFA12_09145 [Stellaceae bacterium]|nr:hypothetical protein [Stellaceae bacterium]